MGHGVIPFSLPPCQMNRTGDGHKMGVWAGGEIELTTHTKMIHDARVGRVDTPHLPVNAKGERFMCEGPMQGYLNNYVREYIHEAGGDAKAGNLYIVVPHEFGMGLSAIIGGLLINADNQVLKADEHTPIDGLFAVGNVSGCFYGGVDYPMDVLGLSIGRAITGGYLAGKHVASL